MLGEKTLPILESSLKKLKQGFDHLPDFDYEKDLNLKQVKKVIFNIAERMKNNYPYHHPLYAGQMLKPPHPIASLAYSLAMWVNPNNHAIDGGRESTKMEKEVIHKIAQLVGYNETYLGHLCSGGTIANMEALWVSSLINKDRYIVASDQAHYTHERICKVLQVPFKKINSDSSGRICIEHLRSKLENGDIGTVVATLGTTALGSVDSLDSILKLREKFNFRIHVDAAYGGYFNLANNLSKEVRAAFNKLHEADSIVIDPHKHGLQPYGCGCIMFKNPAIGKFYKHDSPYTYFTSEDLHLGEISLECSRAGSAAVALFATMELMPITKEGEFAKNLSDSINAASKLYHLLKQSKKFILPIKPDLDILVWTFDAELPELASKFSQKLFESLAAKNLHLAMVKLPISLFKNKWSNNKNEARTVMCLRSCLIKPQHYNIIDKIYKMIDETADEVLDSFVERPYKING